MCTYLEESPLPEANPHSVRQDPICGQLFNTPVPHAVEGFELDPADGEVMVKVWPAGSAVAQEVGFDSHIPPKLTLICNMQILSRFLNTKARSSQLGTANPLADGAEISDKRSRIFMYAEKRDRGDQDTTSRLSPYLSAGVISPRECIRATMALVGRKKVDAGRTTGIGRWVQELGMRTSTMLKTFLIYNSAWRDFYTNVLANFPQVSMGRPFQERLTNVKWEINEEHLAAWKQGKTGVPIVDAAMRQMNTMGTTPRTLTLVNIDMFFRLDAQPNANDYRDVSLQGSDVRLASGGAGELLYLFITECLICQHRKKYFMEQLIDGDLASNNGGWQWSASTGVDPAPYFRIFNPYTQSSKADPTGDYIRMYVPELRNLHGSGNDLSFSEILLTHIRFAAQNSTTRPQRSRINWDTRGPLSNMQMLGRGRSEGIRIRVKSERTLHRRVE